MSTGTLHALTAGDGPAALPRSNGELVFEAPWQSRAFGVAIALHDAGAIDYEAFRACLIAGIEEHERSHGVGGDGGHYYERWLEALEQVLLAQKVVSADDLDRRSAEIAHAWAHDHDHDPAGSGERS